MKHNAESPNSSANGSRIKWAGTQMQTNVRSANNVTTDDTSQLRDQEMK